MITPNPAEDVSVDNNEDWEDDGERSNSRLELPRSRTISGMSTTSGSARVKRRGAPNKGIVSNNKVEKFKPQRQRFFRLFKQFYERRIMPGVGQTNAKRVKNTKGEIREQEQRKLSRKDFAKLFGSDFLMNFPEEIRNQLVN